MTDTQGTDTMRWIVPALVGIAALVAWEAIIHIQNVPEYVVPAPSAVARALAEHFDSLMAATGVTLMLALMAFALAVLGGGALAILFSQSRLIEMSLFPYAVILQVTPVVAIAPLILIWVGVDNPRTAILILAWIVAFFPILSNTTIGLRSVDRNLIALFEIYGASRFRVLTRLQLPSALPFVLTGMKISGGLSLIAVVTAEFVAGSGESGGLAWRIMEAGNRLEIPRMFAALLLLSALGIVFYVCLSALERYLLKNWHESAQNRDD